MVSPDDQVGGYRILSRLGSGGMGEVYLAEHVALGHRVAIKFLREAVSHREDLVARFVDEARAATQIKDPGVVHVHDIGSHEGSSYIVMEELVGESLAARLARVHSLPLDVGLRLATQVALTMAVAHGRGIIHRDLKPENLFVVGDPLVEGGERVKVLDFGVAKLLHDDSSLAKTQTGALLGTPMYMSPEQCRGTSELDHRTDIYALGCVVFHLITGRPPFVADNAADLIASHLLEEPPLPSEVRPALPPTADAIVARCLAKSPGERFATMSELARALADAAGQQVTITPIAPQTSAVAHAPTVAARAELPGPSTVATGASVPEVVAERPERTRRWGPAIGAVVLAGGVVAVAGWRLRARDEPASVPLADAAVLAPIVDAAVDTVTAPDVPEAADAAPVQVDAVPPVPPRDAGARPTGKRRDAGVDYDHRSP